MVSWGPVAITLTEWVVEMSKIRAGAPGRDVPVQPCQRRIENATIAFSGLAAPERIPGSIYEKTSSTFPSGSGDDRFRGFHCHSRRREIATERGDADGFGFGVSTGRGRRRRVVFQYPGAWTIRLGK